MTGNYAYTPEIWLPALMAILMVALSTYGSRRRYVPGATALMVASLFAAAWAVGSLLEAAVVEVGTKIFWFKVQAAVQLPMIVATTCFVLEYAWPGCWLNRRNLALLFLPALAAIVLILTNDLHGLAWRGFVVNGSVHPQLGLGSWLSAVYILTKPSTSAYTAASCRLETHADLAHART